MFAWAGNQTQPGGFYRVRYTGKPADLPVGLKAKTGGVEITFTDALDPASAADPKNYEVKVWGLKRSQNYGSKHIDEKPLAVDEGDASSADGKTVRLEIPDLAPTWGMEIKYRVKGADGRLGDRGDPQHDSRAGEVTTAATGGSGTTDPVHSGVRSRGEARRVRPDPHPAARSE